MRSLELFFNDLQVFTSKPLVVHYFSCVLHLVPNLFEFVEIVLKQVDNIVTGHIVLGIQREFQSVD